MVDDARADTANQLVVPADGPEDSRMLVGVGLVFATFVGRVLSVVALALVGVFVQPLWPYWVMAAATIASFWWRERKDILAA